MQIRMISILACAGLMGACAADIGPEANPPRGEKPGPDEPNVEPNDTGEAEPEEPTPFSPTEGEWTKLEEYLPLDDCNMADWVSDGPGGTITVAITGEKGMSIQHGHGAETCVFDEEGFECSGRATEDTTAQDEYGLDALVLLDLQAQGLFESEDFLEMQTDIVARCEGEDCWLVELATAAFPCEMQVVLRAESL